jgi:hypothetical protein
MKRALECGEMQGRARKAAYLEYHRREDFLHGDGKQ